MKKARRVLELCVINMAFVCNVSLAMEPYDNFPMEQGVYYVNYTASVTSDRLINSKGDTQADNVDFRLGQNLARLAYYNNSYFGNTFVTNIAIPGGRVELGDEYDSGTGDLLIINGYWILDNKSVGPNLAAALLVTAPTGDYDEDRAINLGANIWHFRPMINYAEVFGRFQLEASYKYNIYMENDSTGYKKGYGSLIEALFGYHFERAIVGVNLNLEDGNRDKLNGEYVQDSELKRHQWGVSGNYNLKDGPSVALEYIKDFDVENALDTEMVLLQLAWKLL